MDDITTWDESHRPWLYFIRHHLQHLLRNGQNRLVFASRPCYWLGAFPWPSNETIGSVKHFIHHPLHSRQVWEKKTKWQNHQANTKQTVVFAGQLRIVLLKIGFENIGCRWKKKKHMAVSLFSQAAPVVGSICQASKTKRLRWASQLLPAAERGRVRIDGRVGEKM